VQLPVGIRDTKALSAAGAVGGNVLPSRADEQAVRPAVTSGLPRRERIDALELRQRSVHHARSLRPRSSVGCWRSSGTGSSGRTSS
jgi:hypothetical protein